MKTGTEIIATEITLPEIKLRKRMRAIDDGFNVTATRKVAHCFHRCDLTGDVDHVRNENQASAISNSFFERCGDLAEAFRRNWNLNELEFKAFPFFPLTQRCKHPRIILGGGENFVAGFEVHAHQQSLERLRSIACNCNLFPIAAE